MREQLAGASHAGLHLVEQQQNALLVGERAQILEEAPRDLAHAALAHDRLDQDPGGFIADRRLDRVHVERIDLVEAVDRRAEAFEMLGLRASGDGCERPAVEGAFEGDEPVALGRAVLEMIAPRGLDCAFDGLGAGIGEEHHVGEGRRGEPRPEPLLLGDAMQIGDVPELVGLLGERRDQTRMRVPERGDGHAAGEVEIALAFRGVEIGAVPAGEGKLAAGIGRKEGRHRIFAVLK